MRARTHAPGLRNPAGVPLWDAARSHEGLGDAGAEIQGSSEDPQHTCALRQTPCGDSPSGQRRLSAALTSMIGKPTKRAKGKIISTGRSDLDQLDSTQSLLTHMRASKRSTVVETANNPTKEPPESSADAFPAGLVQAIQEQNPHARSSVHPVKFHFCLECKPLKDCF